MYSASLASEMSSITPFDGSSAADLFCGVSLSPLFSNLCINRISPASLQPVPNTHNPTHTTALRLIVVSQPIKDVILSNHRCRMSQQNDEGVVDQRAHRLRAQL
ncbi:hypothetical protein BLNAU_7236 [Blattamonas nauphoetae]|uniref:Uncharacterized protein n=1 Tax=Blattamonas nauphoetae TaxID=2049346 RepID=A0ABQ9Y221_9EUKA|nr:hypothetical protein BLNAU_7236 [Blattamonas nauphoetae]